MKKAYIISFYTEIVNLANQRQINEIARQEDIRFLEKDNMYQTYIPKDYRKLGKLIDKLSETVNYIDEIHVLGLNVEDDILKKYKKI